MTRTYRFIGGPLHNQIMAMPDGLNYHDVAKFPKLPGRISVSDMAPTTALNVRKLTYTKRSVGGFEFFMLSTMHERVYLGAFLGVFPSKKAEKRRRRKENDQKRKEAIMRQKGYRPWQGNP